MAMYLFCRLAALIHVPLDHVARVAPVGGEAPSGCGGFVCVFIYIYIPLRRKLKGEGSEGHHGCTCVYTLVMLYNVRTAPD